MFGLKAWAKDISGMFHNMFKSCSFTWLKGELLQFLNFAIEYVANDIKNSNIGSSKMYRLRINTPTSNSIKAPAIQDAVNDCVISQTVK